ncbi:hypothetical protein SAMN05519103_09060 [Rhizobiales bacterium GAS113]|nr:hypothetical protein SAMN05519103_09060 [Rhizobiales bacterium GAS113]
MEARAERGFSVRHPTTRLVVEALRSHAREVAILASALPRPYEVEIWNGESGGIDELVATTGDLDVGRAAFTATVAKYPGRRITLRQRARVLIDSERPDEV